MWLRTNFKLDASHKERKVPDLPPKTLFKSFSDKKFHDERQRGLEQFLKAIVSDEAFMDENSTSFRTQHKNPMFKLSPFK